MDVDCKSLRVALRDLDRIAPGAPLLALGQTVLWDEPMKAGIALALQKSGSRRRFIAGIHDTDYFAKLPYGPRRPGQFEAFPHNATTTKGLWSAAGEFSALLGGETVIQRQDFLSSGASLDKVTRRFPNVLDEYTEAFGWRGIVSLDDEPPVTSDVPLQKVFPAVNESLNWAIQQSLNVLSHESKRQGEEKSDELWTLICDAYDANESSSLTEFYRSMLPSIYSYTASEEVGIETTVTSELLKFNRDTCGLPRFHLVERFVDPKTRTAAEEAYNSSLQGSEIYGLDRFGTGALPFDLVIPGKGRGTLRLGNRGIVIMSRKPQFISLKKPVTTLLELADAIESKFGPDCVLIGKAVTLIGMLSTEFVFVFHEGASSYVRYTRQFHQRLERAGAGLAWNPILRVRYSSWDGLQGSTAWLKLPKEFHYAFGTEELCATSFASRWKKVGDEQMQLLEKLRDLRRPIELARFLNKHVGGAWIAVAKEYEQLHKQMHRQLTQLADFKAERKPMYEKLRELKQARVAAEQAKGEHFRSAIFEKAPSELDLAKRQELADRVEEIVHEISHLKREINHSIRMQAEVASSDVVQKLHERRRSLELEMELKRMRLIRNAVICSRGLMRAGQRPSAWWFPLVSPDGSWFRTTWQKADCYLEPLGGVQESCSAM